MSSDLHSPSWYRVAELRPRLRSHVRIHRHHYRGELWYVLEDRVSRRMHRFNRVAHYVVGLMDGRRTLQEIWGSATNRFGDDAPTQDEVIRLLGQLHGAELLQSEVTPDLAELLRRARRQAKKPWLRALLSPLAVKIPLFDPDRALERWLPWYKPLFGWFGAILWSVTVGVAIFQAAGHWNELTEDIASRVLAPQNLLLIWLTFPVLKLLHEFGHACAVKAWGGEVHEMGIMFLVLMPIPYVDASAASAFTETRHRVVVGAAGMIVELFVCSLALFFWVDMGPGIVRAVLYNAMLIAGVSTVIFNGNPLLRYDGYYILADLTQIPNLRVRGTQYLTHLAEKHLFGLQVAEFEATRGERRWLVFFTIASFLYRMFVMCAIALFIATKYLLIGVLLAIWVAVTSIAWPLVKGVGYLLLHPRLRRRRVRAIATSAAIAGAAGVLLFAVPIPHWSSASGVIWVPDEAVVRVGADGFVKAALAVPGSFVTRGSALIVAEDPVLVPRARVLEAQLRLLRARAQAEFLENRVLWERTKEEIQAAEAELAYVHRQMDELTILSPTSGTFVLSVPVEDLPGRFLKKGQQIGYVVPAQTATARVLVSQDDVDLVRERTSRVEVKLAGRTYDAFPARVRREVPAANTTLSNLALSSVGGGPAPVNPRDTKEPKTLDSWFEFELDLPSTRTQVLGEHVYVRFWHGDEPLAERLYRAARQLFMKRFTV